MKRRSFYATCPGRDETNSARPDPLTLFNYKSPRVRFGLGLVYLCSPPFFQLPRSRVRTPRHGDWRRTPLPPPRRGRADAMRCDGPRIFSCLPPGFPPTPCAPFQPRPPPRPSPPPRHPQLGPCSALPRPPPAPPRHYERAPTPHLPRCARLAVAAARGGVWTPPNHPAFPRVFLPRGAPRSGSARAGTGTAARSDPSGRRA